MTQYPDVVYPGMNRDLIGMCCIGCGADYPVDDYPFGCPACQERGAAANLYCVYDEASPGGTRLPITNATTLGEAGTPLFPAPSGLSLAGVDLWVKDESANPTGSHKDRFGWGAVGRAAAAGYRGVVAASSGNAALAVAAYAAAYRLECDIAMTTPVSEPVLSRVHGMGARTRMFDYHHERWEFTSRFARSTERLAVTNNAKPVVGCSPFGIDGFKPLAWEIWQRWQALPDHVVLPASRGDLATGVYLGMSEVAARAGLCCPRMHLVEPFPRLAAVRAGADVHDTFPGESAKTPSIGGDTTTVQALQVLDSSGGEPVVIGSAEAETARQSLAQHGLLYELSSAVVLPAVAELSERHVISVGESVVLVMTSHAFKGL